MVVINEIMFHPRTKQPEYLVLTNLTATPLDIANWRVTEGVHLEFPGFSTNHPSATLLRRHERIVLSSHSEAETRANYKIPPEVRVFGPWTGKLSNEGERVTVRDKNGALACSVKYGVGGSWPASANADGFPLLLIHPNGRVDDGRNWTTSAARVTAVTPLSTSGVIINEIMFDPPSGWPGSEYIELLNGGAGEADISGWKFCEGIQFEFAGGTRIPAGGFLVIAADAGRMRKIYGDLAMLGNFTGRLKGAGEIIRLVDRQGNTVNEVAYNAGGEWPELAGGGGSSLELIHPRMDNRQPSAWAASSESEKSALRHYSFTNDYRELDPRGEPEDYRELHVYLAGRGHAVLENLKLLADGTNCLADSTRLATNGSAAGGWLCQGTHAASFVTNGEFHLVSDGRGDSRANHAELDAQGLRPNQRCELQFDARWISGSPRLVVETWDGSLSRSFLLEVPQTLGTPGRQNSQALPEPPPQVSALRHQPAVPGPKDTVRITAQVHSSMPLGEVKLFHRLDRTTNDEAWRSIAMVDDGSRTGDAVAGDGVFTAELPSGLFNGTVVQFFVRAITTNGLFSEMPAAGAERPALFVVDDRELPKDLRTVRLVLSARDLNALKEGGTPEHRYRFPRLSNHYFNATVIEGEDEIIYGAEVRQSGSPITRTDALQKFKMKLPADRAFRGRTKFVFDDDAAGGRAYHDRVTRYLLYLLGAPANENEFVRMIVNAKSAVLREEVEPLDNEFLDRNFKDGRRGELYRIDDDWRVLDSGQGFQRDAEWAYRGTDDASVYRHSWMKRTRETEDDSSKLITLFKTLSDSNASPQQVDQLLDAPASLKVAAVRGYIGDWDNFTMQRGKNGYLFRPVGDAGFQLLHWDSDEGFLTGQPLYGERIKRWVEESGRERLFHGYLLQLVTLCSKEPARLAAWLAAEREATGASIFQATYLNFFKAREAEVWQDIGEKKRRLVDTNHSSLTPSNAMPMRLSGQPAEK